MTKKILIIGMNTFDSGKTVLSLGIAKQLKENGQRVEYFKPISGSNFWYRYQHMQNCFRDKTCYSFDAYRAKEMLGSMIPIEILNPIHTLFVPAILKEPETFLSHSLAMSGWDSVFAMRRVSYPENEGIRTITLVAEELIATGALMISSEECKALTSGQDIIAFDSLEEVLAYTEQVLEGVLKSSFAWVEEEADYIVIESFNNTAWPWEGLDNVDTILATGPGHIFVYDAERFRKATLLKKFNSQAIREVPFSRVAELIKPIDRILLSAGEELQDEHLEKIGIT